MLVCSQIVDDQVSRIAENHVRIEPARLATGETPDPGNGLTAEGIAIRVVLDRERHIPPALGKHDAAPTADAEEGNRPERTVPDLVHHPAANRCDVVLAAESEARLNLWMEALEVAAKRALVDRGHFGGLRLLQPVLRAEGRSRCVINAIAASASIPAVNVGELNGAIRIWPGLMAAPIIRRSGRATKSILRTKRDGRPARCRSPKRISATPPMPSVGRSFPRKNGKPPRIASSPLSGKSSLGTRPWYIQLRASAHLAVQ